MAQRAATFLMFDGVAEQAMELYVSLFRGARVVRVERYGEGEQGKPGSVKLATFVIAGHEIVCFNSPVKHAFGFTPAVSIFVDCEDEGELERAYEELSREGGVLMPLGNYGFSRRFGWVNDRFGVSWQLNLV